MPASRDIRIDPGWGDDGDGVVEYADEVRAEPEKPGLPTMDVLVDPGVGATLAGLLQRGARLKVSENRNFAVYMNRASTPQGGHEMRRVPLERFALGLGGHDVRDPSLIIRFKDGGRHSLDYCRSNLEIRRAAGAPPEPDPVPFELQWCPGKETEQ